MNLLSFIHMVRSGSLYGYPLSTLNSTKTTKYVFFCRVTFLTSSIQLYMERRKGSNLLPKYLLPFLPKAMGHCCTSGPAFYLLYAFTDLTIFFIFFNYLMQQISTLAGNLIPSYFVWEVIFTMAIIGLGLLLFALLIGSMQNFLQALGKRCAVVPQVYPIWSVLMRCQWV